MAIEFISSYEQETAASPCSVTVSCSSGDLLILYASVDVSQGTYTWPSGFTDCGRITSSYDGMVLGAATKVADGTETSLSVSHSISILILTCLVFRGVDTTTPMDVTVPVPSLGTGTTSPFSHNISITPVTNGAMIVALAGWDVNASQASAVSGAFSGALSWTKACDTAQSYSYLTQSSGYALQNTAAQETVTATGTLAGASAAVLLIVLALRPSATSIPLTQHSFRFFNDDGSESAATAKANINTNINLSANDVARIRFLIDAAGDPTGKQFQLEYRKKPSGGSFGPWDIIEQ